MYDTTKNLLAAPNLFELKPTPKTNKIPKCLPDICVDHSRL